MINLLGFPHPINLRILAAHGDSSKEYGKDIYIYEESSEIGESVQEWIDNYDGDYDGLFIFSCNPAGVEVNSSKSFVIYPSTIHQVLLSMNCILEEDMGGLESLFKASDPQNLQSM